MDEPTVHRRLTAILAADVATYSRLMGMDEAGTHAAWKAHRTDLIDTKITESEGRVVKLAGDGFLAEFPSVVNAVACAATIQRGMRERNAGVPRDRRIELRIGINVGDVIVEADDIYGDGVNVAARLEGIARPGGIVVSGGVRDNVGNRLDLRFEDMGERTLKNIDRPVRAFSVLPHSLPAKSAIGAAMNPPERWAAEKPSVAVLPFNNMSGDPEQEYFSDGITEDIITDLSKISGLFVVARNTTFIYKGKPVSVQQVSQDLGVSFILEGSVRKAGVTGARLRAARRRPRRGSSVGRSLRPRSHRYLRHPGRDHARHCRPVEGQAAARGEEGHPAGADRQRRGLWLLSQRPSVPAPALATVLRPGEAHVREGGRRSTRSMRAP